MDNNYKWRESCN